MQRVTMTFNELVDTLRDYGIRGGYKTMVDLIEKGRIPGASVKMAQFEGEHNVFTIFRKPVMEWLEGLST